MARISNEMVVCVAIAVPVIVYQLVAFFIPGLLPGGLPAELDVYVYDGSSTSEVDVYWVNPSSGRLNFHFFTVSAKQLELVI